MLRVSKWATPLMAVALMLAFAVTVQAEDQKTATGTVAGTVVDKDGKTVSGAKVAIFAPRHMHKHKNANPQAEDADTNQNKAAEAGQAKSDKHKPLFEATTDNNGKFSIANVSVGHYVILAHLKGEGVAHQRIRVQADKTTTVELKLAQHRHKPAAE